MSVNSLFCRHRCAQSTTFRSIFNSKDSTNLKKDIWASDLLRWISLCKPCYGMQMFWRFCSVSFGRKHPMAQKGKRWLSNYRTVKNEKCFTSNAQIDHWFTLFDYARILQLRVVQDAAHPFFDGDLSWLPNEFANGYDAGDAHAAHQDDENTPHVRQAKLIRRGTCFRRIVLERNPNYT